MINDSVSILVVTYNRLIYFKTFIKFLYRSTKYPFELVVIDNGSTDGTRNYILELEKEKKVHKHIFTIKNLPLATAYTECFNKFKSELGEFIITAPDDIAISPELKHDWLEIFIAKMNQDELIGSINFSASRCRHDKFIKRYA